MNLKHTSMNRPLLIGPFAQLLPMTGLPLKGALKDEQLPIIERGGILVSEGKIIKVGIFDEKRFGRGYGEENDFCQRAAKLGFKNIIFILLVQFY